jgi:hypothetical protein
MYDYSSDITLGSECSSKTSKSKHLLELLVDEAVLLEGLDAGHAMPSHIIDYFKD